MQNLMVRGTMNRRGHSDMFTCSLSTLFQLHIASNKGVVSEWIGQDMEGSGPGLILRCYPRVWLGPRKNTKTSVRIAGSSGRDLNPGPPEYESGDRRSIIWIRVSPKADSSLLEKTLHKTHFTPTRKPKKITTFPFSGAERDASQRCKDRTALLRII
jgi:hypothetical protein